MARKKKKINEIPHCPSCKKGTNRRCNNTHRTTINGSGDVRVGLWKCEECGTTYTSVIPVYEET
jgi:ribosomal protein L37AE/L43A